MIRSEKPENDSGCWCLVGLARGFGEQRKIGTSSGGTRDDFSLPWPMRTYSRKKKPDEASTTAVSGLPPLSPPKKKSVWSGFGLKKRKPPVRSAVGNASELDDDGEDEEEEEQAFLELGQRPASDCEYCRMRYSRGLAEEERLHKRYCKRFRFGEKWTGSCSVVKNFADGTRVVVVPHVDSQRDDSAAKRVMEVVDLELGFSESEAPGESNHLQTLYVLVCDKRAVGAIVAVPIAKAFRVDSEHTSDAIVHCCSDPISASLGISRLWVHRDHRGQGYAERMLDCVAEHSATVKSNIAFSQPTQMGRKVAVKWFGREDFLVFKE